MQILDFILILLSYILGSIPFGYILTKKSTGLNILELGSGNIGSTNVSRIAGKGVALKVQLLDMMKGLVPVSLIILSNKSGFYIFPNYFIFLIALSAIIGHSFSVFLHFKGGKGVNTTLGASVLFAPLEVLSAVICYYFVKRQFHYVSAGSIALAVALPLTGLLLHEERNLFIYLLLCCVLILVRHTPNIKRLISGNEIL